LLGFNIRLSSIRYSLLFRPPCICSWSHVHTDDYRILCSSFLCFLFYFNVSFIFLVLVVRAAGWVACRISG